MCTVVFIPGQYNTCIASLRDENPSRPAALPPAIDSDATIPFLAPRDPLGGGTWMGVNEAGHALVLLNGGFTAHLPQKKYRKSRGLIVTALLASEMPVVDWSLTTLAGIEPFTLVAWVDGHLFELVWDGEEQHRKRLDPALPHIWSSATLYNSTAKATREEAFLNWTAMRPPITPRSLLSFFTAGTDTQNGFIINRSNKLQTLSFTFLDIAPQTDAAMHHYDLLRYTHTEASIPVSPSTMYCPLPGR